MNVIVLQVFVSLMLAAGSVALFVWSVRRRDHEHADRLSLLPLAGDDARAPAAFKPPASASASTSTEVKP